jgi:WD40 repeat protein
LSSLLSNFIGHVNVVVGLQTYVLDVHPFNPRIAMSAGYDGRVIIWDVSCFTEIPGTTSLIFLDNETEYVCSFEDWN